MFRVTYSIVTPESAEHGDYAEAGFLNAQGERVEALIGRETPGVDMTLREALRLCSPQEDSGRWSSEVDGCEDYRTGANERRALHPPRNVTAASYSRLARLLGC
jgi:hypothetical protein